MFLLAVLMAAMAVMAEILFLWSIKALIHSVISDITANILLKAAKKVCPEYIGVNTASLKSWLDERRKEKG